MLPQAACPSVAVHHGLGSMPSRCCPEPLVASVVGSGGAAVTRIQEQSGAHLTFSPRGKYFPSSRLRILVISGAEPDGLLAALDLVLDQVVSCGEEERQVLEGAGTLGDDDGDFIDAAGEYRVRCALTESAAANATGPKGRAIESFREETGARLSVESDVYENHQLATLGGSREQLILALERLNSFVQADVNEPWFSRWADQRTFGEPPASDPGLKERGRRLNEGSGTRRPGHVGCTIFVGGLPQSTEPPALRTHFSRYGEVLEADVRMDPRTGRSKGFGFVTFMDSYMVDSCFENTEEHIIDGKWVDVKRYGELGGGGSDGGRLLDGPAHGRQPDEAPDMSEGEDNAHAFFAEHFVGANSDTQQSFNNRHASRSEQRSHHSNEPDHDGSFRGGDDGHTANRIVPWVPKVNHNDLVSTARGTIPWFAELAGEIPQEYIGLDYCISCSLPNARCGALIGRRGENIMEVERRTGAKVQLSKKEQASEHRQISIIGSLLSVYAAHMLLMRDYNNATPELEVQATAENPSQKIEDLQRQIDSLRGEVSRRRREAGHRR